MASTTFLAGLLGAALGAVLAFAGAWLHYTTPLRAARTRVEQLLRTLAQTNEMLMQARKQTEAVQKELEQARRSRTVPQPSAVRLTEPKPTQASVVVNSAFADTLLQSPPQPRKTA